MNVNHLKENTKNIDEIILTALKEKSPLYTRVEGLLKKQQQQKDTFVTSFTKTEYCRSLVKNAVGVDNTTNTYFKTHDPHPLRKTKHSLFWSNINFQCASV